MAIIGVYLNTKQDIRCFYLWILTNSAFAIETYLLGAWNMFILFIIYLILAFVGIYHWRKGEINNEKQEYTKKDLPG